METFSYLPFEIASIAAGSLEVEGVLYGYNNNPTVKEIIELLKIMRLIEMNESLAQDYLIKLCNLLNQLPMDLAGRMGQGKSGKWIQEVMHRLIEEGAYLQIVE